MTDREYIRSLEARIANLEEFLRAVFPEPQVMGPRGSWGGNYCRELHELWAKHLSPPAAGTSLAVGGGIDTGH